MTRLLQGILQRAPELRLFLTATEPVALPGVAMRQTALAPMPTREAARLFKALAPRPITRHELGCDEPAELKRELQRLIQELAPRLPGLDDFQVRALPEQPLRVQWRLPSLSSAAALQRELQSQSTLLQLDTPPVSASGHAALIGCLSLPKMLARHPALIALQGNPKAISLAVSLLLPDALTPRPIGDVGVILERQTSGEQRLTAVADSGDPLSDSCRAVLEQLQQILAPSSPGRSPSAAHGASPPTTPHGAPPRTPPPLDEDPALSSAPVTIAGEDSRKKLPPSLVLRKDEYLRMMEGEPRWLGAGSIGAVFDVDLGGTRVAVKKFFESGCSSRAFQREAILLAELRHPNIVQLIKVACRAPLCIVTELLVTSLHALLHANAAPLLAPLLLDSDASMLKTCMHIARGMNYLHTLDPPVLHRNLKSQNLLIDEGGKVKIADFGWSRLKTFDAGKTFFHGWQWVAPEILYGGRFTEAADVYSYSMVAWEVLTRSVPFHGLNPVQIGVAVREQKLRPPLPDDCPHGFGELLQGCWHDEPEQRFSFDKILGRMNALVAMSATEM